MVHFYAHQPYRHRLSAISARFAGRADVPLPPPSALFPPPSPLFPPRVWEGAFVHFGTEVGCPSSEVGRAAPSQFGQRYKRRAALVGCCRADETPLFAFLLTFGEVTGDTLSLVEPGGSFCTHQKRLSLRGRRSLCSEPHCSLARPVPPPSRVARVPRSGRRKDRCSASRSAKPSAGSR